MELRECEKDFLEKYDSGHEFDEDELGELRLDLKEESVEYGENERWCRSVTSILKVGNRYFALYWQQGLTESQPDEFYAQPVEVVKHEYEKTITITEWIEKNK